MSSSDAQSPYRPPDAELKVSPPRRPAGPLRVLVAAVGGFAVDVVGTTLLATLLMLVYIGLGFAGEYRQMDFTNPAASIANPWALLDLFSSTMMSVLGGYMGARIAYMRVWPMFAVLASLHIAYPLLPRLDLAAVDWLLFAQLSVLNVGAAFAGVQVCRAQLRRVQLQRANSS